MSRIRTNRSSTSAAPRRTRVDALLVRRGLLSSRAKAEAAILAGEVFVNGVRVTKAGMTIGDDAAVDIRPSRPAYVSRGGLKLDHALREFGIQPKGVVALDVGASTGGFTDCLLKHGAARVYAVDVGTGQLAWELRTDPRVISLERRDIREITLAELTDPIDLVTVDVSFISLSKVLPAIKRLLKLSGTAIVLVKPQFEVGPKHAKRGVVRDPAIHAAVLAAAVDEATSNGWAVVDATPSPLPGPEGNLEFFLLLRNEPGPAPAIDVDVVVSRAHEERRSRAPREPESR